MTSRRGPRASGGWGRLRARLARADFDEGRLLLGLDFDGTLAEIAATPEKAALAAGTRRVLKLLSRRRDTKVAVLSGRAVEDVARLVGLAGVYYAGNHGLEIRGPGIRWTHPRAKGAARPLRRALEDGLKEFPGVLIEYKGPGVAVHYRGVPRRLLPRLRERIRRGPLLRAGGFRLLRGKKIFDLRPDVRWDKGHALAAIRKTLPGRWSAVFVGDDATDEEAFRTIGPRALTIRIGRVGASAARYVLPHRRLVDSLLESLARRPGRRRAAAPRPS